MKPKLIAILVTTVYSISAPAALFNSRLSAYACPSNILAVSCGAPCTRAIDIEVEFTVNKKDKAIQMVYFMKGKQADSSILDKCIIFDDKNWSCEGGVLGPDRMINGIFSSTRMCAK
jgi:hypothetical protein